MQDGFKIITVIMKADFPRIKEKVLLGSATMFVGMISLMCGGWDFYIISGNLMLKKALQALYKTNCCNC